MDKKASVKFLPTRSRDFGSEICAQVCVLVPSIGRVLGVRLGLVHFQKYTDHVNNHPPKHFWGDDSMGAWNRERWWQYHTLGITAAMKLTRR